MKKAICHFVCMLLFFILSGCSLEGVYAPPVNEGGTDTEQPDDPGTTPDDPGMTDPAIVELNLLKNGDFEDEGNLEIWGIQNDRYRFDEQTGNHYLEFPAGGGEISFASFQGFTGTSGVFSAKIKLEKPEDAEKVNLWVERFTDNTKAPDELKKHEIATASTEWQNVEVEVDSISESIFKTIFKVEIHGNEGSVAVDDVKFIPEDNTKVNFLPFGDFSFNDLNAKWMIPDPEGGDNWLPLSAEDGIVKISNVNSKIITSSGYIKDNGVKFPCGCPGILSFDAKVEGEGQLYAFVKVSGEGEESLLKAEFFNLTNDFVHYEMEFDPIEAEYESIEVQFESTKLSEGSSIAIDNVSLNIR